MQMMLTAGSREVHHEPGASALSRGVERRMMVLGLLMRSLLRSDSNLDTALNAVCVVWSDDVVESHDYILLRTLGVNIREPNRKKLPTLEKHNGESNNPYYY